MDTHIRYNWEDIQKYYDDGHSTYEVSSKFGVTSSSINKAKHRGEFKPRTQSEAMKLFNKLNPDVAKKTWTPERRKAQSEAKKELYRKNPEKHPNRRLANNRKKMSYPEKLVYDYLRSMDIEFFHNKKINKYYVDFCLGKLVIEVDGERFHTDKEYDKKRDEIISSYGFIVRRFPAKAILKYGAEIVLKEDFPDEILNGYIELRKERRCVVCNKTFYEKRKTCSRECLKKLVTLQPKTLRCKSNHKENKSIVRENKPIIKEMRVSKEELIELISKYSFVKIGKMYGVSDTTIRKWCRKYGIETKVKDPCTVSELLECVNEGMYRNEIARKFGVNKDRIKTFARRHNIEIPLKIKPMDKKLIDLVIEYIIQGLRNQAICELTGLDQKQVSAIRCRNKGNV